eukprot:CAMPEP_0172372272 /NCGR_PEP_ID=MMETSP1060-20121228/46796_1 /TAXON_ID=37318 /ORGANISM="Pseudo-nitzschia pungens, Strain cf. cingulata" /LENGTH=114 /DNA_ID=CAMNT_0013098189 /DNA_START=69 /DNA_END=410 /DNA_ORIENTATION=+
MNPFFFVESLAFVSDGLVAAVVVVDGFKNASVPTIILRSRLVVPDGCRDGVSVGGGIAVGPSTRFRLFLGLFGGGGMEDSVAAASDADAGASAGLVRTESRGGGSGGGSGGGGG